MAVVVVVVVGGAVPVRSTGMTRLRPYPVLALAAWSLFLWTSRLGLAWKTESTLAGKVVATVPVAVFVALGAALLVVLWRRPAPEAATGVLRGNRRSFVQAVAAWTMVYWAVRTPLILLDGRSVAFRAVHVVLATVSVGLAVWAGRTTQRGARLTRGEQVFDTRERAFPRS